jgi:antitoxin (DNA-binding transcriptional repressor) of toxin-antitoxin stability system
MKTLTAEEASSHLIELVHSAAKGEEITIRAGAYAVLLQPVANDSPGKLTPREALRKLQSQSHLTHEQAESYLREVRAERLAHGE